MHLLITVKLVKMIKIIYDINIVRIRAAEKNNFGTIEDLDRTVYEAHEIQFHTPSEHTIKKKKISIRSLDNS